MTRPRRAAVRRRRSALMAAVAVLVAVLVSACGAGTAPDGTPIPSAADLYATVRAAALEARSGHVTGFLTHGEDRVLQVNLEGTADGSNQRIRLSSKGRGSASLLVVEDREYVSADWDFWAAATEPKVADTLKDRQVRLETDKVWTYPDLSLGGILREAFREEALPWTSRFTSSVKMRHENDHDIWVLVVDEGHEIWVDRESGLPLRLVRTLEDPADLTFDSWGEVAPHEAPRKARVYKG